VEIDTNPDPANDADPSGSGSTALITGLYLLLSVADPDPDPRFYAMTENDKKVERGLYFFKKNTINFSGLLRGLQSSRRSL
jgi:hypothetical protein